ncbi:hypothetical protein DH2020_042517 [Rehmannia glutinosa]|uniref:CBS domain-containing protein n=1 Tax=Rehmannia glutinosa TaxID=99300 RepID=A0ABR0UNM9_REHGL
MDPIRARLKEDNIDKFKKSCFGYFLETDTIRLREATCVTIAFPPRQWRPAQGSRERHNPNSSRPNYRTSDGELGSDHPNDPKNDQPHEQIDPLVGKKRPTKEQHSQPCFRRCNRGLSPLDDDESRGSSSRRSVTLTSSSSQARKAAGENGGRGGVVGNSSSHHRKSISASRSMGLTGERTVKRLRLSKALTVPETTSINEACRRMAARRVDALLLTDSNALLGNSCFKVMTRNPVFVLSDTLAVEALQKMVQGKFRHLPVVENGEVIALLDIAKCLYDAIARMERAAEKGKAIAAAVEGVEKHWGHQFLVCGCGFLPMIVTVDPNDTVLVAAKKMLEIRASSAIVTVENKPRGILTSKDMLMRVIAQDLPPESTLVEKVMTPNPECATVDTPIVDALHTMHDGKFLHLPVVDKDGLAVAVIDVLHITHAALATVGSTAGVNSEAANTMMQKFWDSAMELPPDDEDETRSENSSKMPSDGGETGRSIPYPSSTSSSTQNLADLITAILQRVGDEIDRNKLPQILYEDEDKDKVVLASDSDLQAAVDHARLAGWKVLIWFEIAFRLFRNTWSTKGSNSSSLEYAHADAWASAYSAVAAGAALVAV